MANILNLQTEDLEISGEVKRFYRSFFVCGHSRRSPFFC